jgi:hypothetical protein
MWYNKSTDIFGLKAEAECCPEAKRRDIRHNQRLCRRSETSGNLIQDDTGAF